MQDRMNVHGREDLTQRLVQRCMQARYEELPADVRTVAAQCVLDWLGVSLGAVGEMPPRVLLDELACRGGVQEATVIGSALRLPAASAAEYNGTLGHMLDYDDVHLAITGHATAVLLPALLALAQQLRTTSGAQLLAALVAGCEMVSRVGKLIAPSHYDRGFHSTSTAGSLGAALACAHLAGLSQERACIALGLAATQASGLKALFGSMGKPWHAGLAARNGVMAAQLAARGFTGPVDILENPQGFSQAYSDDFHPAAALEEPEGGWHLRNTLFKYHASCFGTSACMEALLELQRGQGFSAEEVESVGVCVHSSSATVCNIPAPANDTEAKFSLRACAAMTLAGLDTSVPQTFSADSLAQTQVRRLVPCVEVGFSADLPRMASDVRVTLKDGREHRAFHDAGIAMRDLAAQQGKLEGKFQAIVSREFGDAPAQRVSLAVRGLALSPSLEPLAVALRDCAR
jgi:2-methylcitrate dehydratase PrpD